MQSMYYIGLDVHKKTISYCVKDGQRADSFAGCDSRYTIGLGPLDENSPPTVDGRHGSDYLHGLDLRSFPSAAKKKNDRIDANKIADCLRCHFLPECYMAATEIRERRRTLRYRNLLVHQAVQLKNKISG